MTCCAVAIVCLTPVDALLMQPPLPLPSKTTVRRTVFDYFVDEYGEWQSWNKRLAMPPDRARAAGGGMAASVSPWRLAFDTLRPDSTLDFPVRSTLSLGTRVGVSNVGTSVDMPTVSLAQAWYMLSLLTVSPNPVGVLVAGPPACAKSMLVRRFVSRLGSLSREAVIDREMAYVSCSQEHTNSLL